VQRGAALGFLAAVVALAQGSENVLVVVNRNSAVSRRIGEYYSFRRGIPRANVCVIDAPIAEAISREVYDKRWRPRSRPA